MPPRIAIPLPHSGNSDYCARALPQYEHAVTLAGGNPVRIPLDLVEAAKLISACDAVLLPGSNADLDPTRFSAPRSPHTEAADPLREAVDDLLLDDAYRARKPILGICYGLQSLNVHRSGSLIQHIPNFLPESTREKVNHEAGRAVSVAHTVEIQKDSKLAEILREGHGLSSQPALSKRSASKVTNTAIPAKRALAPEGNRVVLAVNSSHHQAAEKIGAGLRVIATCPDDGIIEALEGTDPAHFVLAVQWHPERSVDEDEPSRAIFRALVKAAQPRSGERIQPTA
jgi:putative glutamine amidotransferase